MQVGELLRAEIGRIMLQELQDPDLAMASVTSAEVSPDLHFARVWISALGDEEARKRALEAIKRADGKIRREIARTKAFRYIPEIDWKLDQGAVYAGHIENRLKEIMPAQPNEEETAESDDDE